MPIFTKNGRRVLFVHIPKTAGSSVYLMFAANGWQISHLDTRPAKGRVGYDLLHRYGVTPERGPLQSLEGPVRIQHVSYETWSQWGEYYDEAFNFARHPEDRFISAVRFQHRHIKTDETLPAFAQRFMSGLNRAFRKGQRTFRDNHFRPQSEFVGPESVVFNLARGGMSEMCTRYGLTRDIDAFSNQTHGALVLSEQQRAWVNKIYDIDFKTFVFEKR
ncbi:MAG: sulfotransferase family 2 domain-containing protein [Pseudomonadota bacterium]